MRQKITWSLAGLLISLGVLTPSFSGVDFGAEFDPPGILMGDDPVEGGCVEGGCPDGESRPDHDGEPQVDLGRIPVLLLDRAPTNGDVHRTARTASPEVRTAQWEAPFPKIAPALSAKSIFPEERYWTNLRIRNLHWPHGPPLLKHQG